MRKNGTSLGLSTQDFTSREVPLRRPVQPLRFFEQELFYKGVAWADIHQNSFPSPISGGIIPHHLLPSFMIADFFRQLASQNPQTILLIGPNHYELGEYPVLTSLYSWQTPFGSVVPDPGIIEKLINFRLVEVDEAVLVNEHSVAGIIPFIKYYLPEAQVVPFIVSGWMTFTDITHLVEKLRQLMNEKTVLIASVDFSHDLPNQEAAAKDQETLEIMNSFDYRRLLTLNNEHLDSPASITTLLLTMQRLGKTNSEVLLHTNSGELLKDNFLSTTSYFSMIFY